MEERCRKQSPWKTSHYDSVISKQRARCIWEIFSGWQHRADGTPCQFSVTNFTTACCTHATHSPTGVWWKVIVQHECFAVFTGNGIDDLFVLTCSRLSRQRLVFHHEWTEQSRERGKNTCFANNRANVGGCPSVNPWSGFKNLSTHYIGFDVMANCRDFVFADFVSGKFPQWLRLWLRRLFFVTNLRLAFFISFGKLVAYFSLIF